MKTMLNQILRGLMRKHEDTGWVDLPAPDGWNVSAFKYRKCGKVVEVTFEGRKETAVGTEYLTLGTLPEGCRIGVNVYALAFKEMLVHLFENGTIQIRCLNGIDTETHFHVTYLTKN